MMLRRMLQRLKKERTQFLKIKNFKYMENFEIQYVKIWVQKYRIFADLKILENFISKVFD